jgi:hypothetical protein
MTERRKLSDILRGGSGADWLNNGNGDGWGDVQPAPERGPVPPGRYVARVAEGALFNAKKETPGYKLTFEILEGEHKGRLCWYDIWLTDKNKRNAVRDLMKLGIDAKPKLEQPLPRGIRCEIRVALRRSEQGDEFNEVKEFAVVGIDPPQLDTFAPGQGPGNPQSGGGPSDQQTQGGATP